MALLAALPAVALIAAVTSAHLEIHAPAPWLFFMAVTGSPVVEEIVFRLGVQDLLAAFTTRRFGALSGANIGTAIVFAAAHLLRHPLGWALAVALPALAYGYFYERCRHVAAPIGLHAAYNAVFFVWLIPG